ncbi:MAG: NTP pyrophosphohydrolase [Candidatus Gottesmanbacteria bacterium GW2011_GWB1_43_11]|uniref:NTP pyrophosphohydrolase n=1 Tax=Candidatus Gottesmanbacteria bacterium GW2011_GWB1_43_11 TaxID=1618446 RepID=A0A0G1FKH1_9BACT|nr:MAG: NTP pyrophosphohydrolase [Candidatus Gottesmanbacteria bacterium GW2011_GWA2_42_16]KKS53479.1 MAG: NTP pyrophosphohydrolase [Candidatus Gottesmanbacteria bacterium GW2011_GWA1_42_26]KKS81806.1 MAG: NTP pyrophosphohydrolase [Candidatus Gottesmanbacteria bacterium GW2011_GWC1_43_10]KKS87388.1 MAG: NTP pyrophosphohydrolase [Candidatus Gottesmanbacteria bacterium GW2011_GWB1_43_11]OGG10524.1 MAG: hypothetical protein A2699_01910 [Candidatus Gottesmanbacteria bacterium RIFCSPHIGHO2_01_FULL_4
MKKWQTLSSKKVYSSPYLTVYEHDVIRPNNVRAPYYSIERRNFSVVIPLNDKKETYLVSQYRYPTSRYSWEFPMGSVVNKTPLEMAQQELGEETGITAKEWREIGSFYIANSISNQKVSVFVAQSLSLGKPHPEENELLEVQKISIKKVDMMIAQGKILDGPTICAFHLLEVYLNKSSNL